MTNPELTAIEYNNYAASLMESSNGNTESIIAALTTALKSSQRIMNTHFQDKESGVQIGYLDQCMMNNITIHEEERCGKICPDTFEDDDGPSTYWRPIRIPQKMISSLDFELNMIKSAIIIFNLAMAYHMKAMKFGIVTNHVALRKAARLYELAYNSMQDVTMNNSLFAMTVVNNMGMVYQSLDDITHAEECFQHLLSRITLMIDSGHGHLVSKFANGLFVRSISHLISKSITAKAA